MRHHYLQVYLIIHCLPRSSLIPAPVRNLAAGRRMKWTAPLWFEEKNVTRALKKCELLTETVCRMQNEGLPQNYDTTPPGGFLSKHLDFRTLPSVLRSDSAPLGITELFCSRADSVISLVTVSSPALTQWDCSSSPLKMQHWDQDERCRVLPI